MFTGWDIYWITRLDVIKNLLTIILVCAGMLTTVLVIISAIMWAEADIEQAKKMLRNVIISTGIISPFLILFLLIPTTKEMFAIKVLPKVVNSKDIQEIPSIAVKFTKEWLKGQLEGLSKRLDEQARAH